MTSVENHCGSCGKKLDADKEHDTKACWNETKLCSKCGGLYGYDWDSDPLHKTCKGCGYRVDKV